MGGFSVIQMFDRLIALATLGTLLCSICGCGQNSSARPRHETAILVYALAPGETADPDAMSKAIETRLKLLRFTVQEVRKLPKDQFEIELVVKSENELLAAKKLIGLTEALEFRILASQELHSTQVKSALDPAQKRARNGEWFWAEFDPEKIVVDETMITRVDEDGRNEVLVMDDDLDMDGSYIQFVAIGDDANGRKCLQGKTTGEGAFLLAQLTRSRDKDQKRHLAVVFNHKVISAVPIRERIAQYFEITGMLTDQELHELVGAIKRGGFPARLDPNPVSERRTIATD